jgi:hypothetical protein
MDRELADDRLARPCGGCDQDAAPALERVASLDLERIEVELLARGEGGRLRVRSAVSSSGIALGG